MVRPFSLFALLAVAAGLLLVVLIAGWTAAVVATAALFRGAGQTQPSPYPSGPPRLPGHARFQTS